MRLKDDEIDPIFSEILCQWKICYPKRRRRRRKGEIRKVINMIASRVELEIES